MERLYAEKVKQLYKNMPIGLTASLVNSLILVILLWEVVPSAALSIWFAASVTLAAFGYLHFLKFTRSEYKTAEFRKYEFRFNIWIGLSGLLWGSAGVFLFPINSLPHQVLIVFVSGGMVAGAAGTYSISMKAFLAFSLPALFPVIVKFFLIGDPVRMGMGGMTLLFGCLMYLTAKRVRHAILMVFKLKFENSDLIENLEGRVRQRTAELANANEAMHQLNENLEIRVAERTAEAEHRAEALRQLALELSGAEDLERRRIAMTLHDDLQQYLVAIRFRLGSLLPKELADPKTAEKILAVESLVDESIQKCRNLSHELSPPVLQLILWKEIGRNTRRPPMTKAAKSEFFWPTTMPSCGMDWSGFCEIIMIWK